MSLPLSLQKQAQYVDFLFNSRFWSLLLWADWPFGHDSNLNLFANTYSLRALILLFSSMKPRGAQLVAEERKLGLKGHL